MGLEFVGVTVLWCTGLLLGDVDGFCEGLSLSGLELGSSVTGLELGSLLGEVVEGDDSIVGMSVLISTVGFEEGKLVGISVVDT